MNRIDPFDRLGEMSPGAVRVMSGCVVWRRHHDDYLVWPGGNVYAATAFEPGLSRVAAALRLAQTPLGADFDGCYTAAARAAVRP